MGTIEDIRKAFQDFLAPEVRSITVKVESLEKRMNERFDDAERQTSLKFDVLIKTIEALRAEIRSEFLLMRLHDQVEVSRQVAPLSERVAVLEAAKH